MYCIRMCDHAIIDHIHTTKHASVWHDSMCDYEIDMTAFDMTECVSTLAIQMACDIEAQPMQTHK